VAASEVIAMSSEAPFSELLRQQRRAAGYSQEDLAERARLSVGAIGSLEQGLRRAPHRDTVKALADALGMPQSERRQFEEAAARARGRKSRDVSSLPASLTSFIARDEVNEIEGLLADHRLITIIGSGGIGKTRVAIEVARRGERLYDEVWFVDLLPVRDGAQVTAQIAARLNVPVAGEDGLSGIVAHLRSRTILLVVDNCEHVVDEVAFNIEKLLHQCSALTVLATSREALGLSGELAFHLPSMNAATASDLFVARARAADPRWYADAQRLVVVAEICKELDGIPLAIELAASRVSTLGLEAVRSRLRGGINLSGGRNSANRHQTMAATIAWSYDLLKDHERLLFRRLSAFMGGFTLQAAEESCADEALPVDTIAEALSQLVNKSLINSEHVGTSIRYRFLEPVRAFAWELLVQSGELETAMWRFIGWLKRKAALIDSVPPSQLLADERVELDNVRFAIRWAESTMHYPAIVAVTEVLIGFRLVWYTSGRHVEVRALGFRLLELLKESENPDLVGLLVNAIVGFLTVPEVLELSKRAIPLLTNAGHRALAAELHSRCASAECMRGDAAAAESHLVRGEALLSPEDRRRSHAGFSFATHAAYVRCMLEDFAGARASLDGLEIPPGDAYEVDVRILLAEIEFREGRGGKAIEILRSVKPDLERYYTAKHLTILVCGNLATYELALENADAAEEALREALKAAIETRDFTLSTCTADLGRYAAFFSANAGRVELAARLLGVCDRDSNLASLEDGPRSRELATNAIEARLPRERAEALRRSGAAEDLYEVLAEFLGQPAAADNARESATSSPRA
jgi:predicted ATPase/DNA-binding XRE family transcriptional regulator